MAAVEVGSTARRGGPAVEGSGGARMPEAGWCADEKASPRPAAAAAVGGEEQVVRNSNRVEAKGFLISPGEEGETLPGFFSMRPSLFWIIRISPFGKGHKFTNYTQFQLSSCTLPLYVTILL